MYWGNALYRGVEREAVWTSSGPVRTAPDGLVGGAGGRHSGHSGHIGRTDYHTNCRAVEPRIPGATHLTPSVGGGLR